MTRPLLFLSLLLVAASVPAEKTVVMPVDLGKPPIKDLRNSRTAPDLGYAGDIADLDSPYYEEFFVRNPERTWEVMRAGGARTLKEWNANGRWQNGMAYAACKTEEEREAFRANWNKRYRNMWNQPLPMPGDPKYAYDFRKKHNIRVLLCIEQYGSLTNVWEKKDSNDIADVKRDILAFVQWIVDNGYRDQVAGFELGNEPFFECQGGSPEKHAARWGEIVPEIKRIFPEANIGIPVAEYRDGDPDIAAVRARSTAVDSWFKESREFGFQNLNQWSGRFIVAFSNHLDLCSHVVYHFYGGDAAYGCGGAGFKRIQNFAKVFPEIKDKRVWITEWRERSDEDRRCHLTHASTLFKAHYMLTVLAQPNIDGIYLHSCDSIAGGFNTTSGKGTWRFQTDENNKKYPVKDNDGRPRIEVGPCGPLFNLYNEALLKHPIILTHAGNESTPERSSWWYANSYYEFSKKMVRWQKDGADPAKRPRNTGSFEWVALTDPEHTSLVILAANTSESVWKPTLELTGRRPAGKGRRRTIACPVEKLWIHQIPGEQPLYTITDDEIDTGALSFAPYTITSITIRLDK